MEFLVKSGLQVVTAIFILCGMALGYSDPTQITVLVNDSAGVPSAVLKQAEAEAARVFRIAGIDITWLNCVGENLDELCRVVPTADEFVLHIVPDGKTSSEWVFGKHSWERAERGSTSTFSSTGSGRPMESFRLIWGAFWEQYPRTSSGTCCWAVTRILRWDHRANMGGPEHARNRKGHSGVYQGSVAEDEGARGRTDSIGKCAATVQLLAYLLHVDLLRFQDERPERFYCYPKSSSGEAIHISGVDTDHFASCVEDRSSAAPVSSWSIVDELIAHDVAEVAAGG